MNNILIPEFAVSDWRRSKHFYCSVLGFDCLYERPEEGFCFLNLGGAERQIALGRDDIHDRLGLGKVELPVQEGPLGELAGLGHPGPTGHQALEDALGHQHPAMPADLENILPGVAGRPGEPGRKDVINDSPRFVLHRLSHSHPG